MRFDLNSVYSLLHAFDLTGRRIFGNTWRGDEAFARPADDPHAVEQDRQQLLDRIKARVAEAQPHHAVLALDAGDTAHQDASDALHAITVDLDRLKRQLNALPLLSDVWVTDYDAFQRRQRIEKELRGGFETGALQLQVGPSEIVQWASWTRQPDFKIYYGLSMVRLPLSQTGTRRRGPAFIEKVAFDHWLGRFEASEIATGELTPQARLEHWLRDKVRRHKAKEKSKSEYRADALADIPGLSERAFNSVWDQIVPDTWRKPGRTPLKPEQ